MTIVRLKKLTLYGYLDEKQQILDQLQQFGCIHVTPLIAHENILDKNVNSRMQTVEALRYLNSCPKRLKQITNVSTFDPIQIEQQVLENKHQTEERQDELDSIKRKINELEPWGNFILPNPQEILNHKFWFYIVPHHEMKKNTQPNIAVVHKDNRFNYVIVIAENEPENMPGKQIKPPKEPLNVLQSRLEEIEFELENLLIERIQLTRWFALFKSNLYKLEDQAALESVSLKSYDTSPLFALQGWIPVQEINKLIDYAKQKTLAIKIEDPNINDQPPTLLENQAPLKGGEDLLSFYMTPSYWLWDPSTTVFFSFAIFFAMIFSDAGYAIILGAILAFFWKRLGNTVSGKRFRNVLLALTVFSFIWGILVGSYFGVAPSSNSYLGYLKIFDISNYAAMMMLAILVGVTHIAIANLTQAWSKRKSLTALANIGWTSVLIGALVAFIGFKYSKDLAKTIGIALLSMGLLAVVLFTSLEKPIWKRLLTGLMGLTRVTGMFGDVLSYLRLFALGLASASLAAVFNDLAKQIYHSLPGFKILIALLILLIGHGINFVLSLMSGFIHGLRLNFIEFFNWGLPDEGTPFKAFSKKEMSRWNH